MKTLAKLLIIFGSVAFLVGVTLGLSFVWDAFLRLPSHDSPKVVLTVVSGERVKDISRSLKILDLIPSRFGFEFYTKLIRAERLFQPGEFTLPVGLNYASIVSALTAASPDEVTITFPEGLTREQMAVRVDSVFGKGRGEEWQVSLDDPKWLATYSFFSGESLEGYLFPDTYRVSRSSFPDDLTYKLLTNFDKKLSPELRLEISRQGKTIQEIIILASIIEKEVISDKDRAVVADLFWRRLDIGMALQADSTVNYVTGKNDPAVFNSDRAVDSLFNTYKYPGLPPAPICNPSLSAIQATIYPQENNYWYFLTDAEGGVHYARTNDEQNENKMLYLR